MARPLIVAVAALALAACEDDQASTTQTTSAPANQQVAAVAASVPAAAIREDDLVVGDQSAPVTVIAYESLTCPHCASFHRTIWPSLKTDFVDTGDVKFVFRDFPLNRPALFGSALARCFEGDSRYGMVEMMYARQSEWAGAADPAVVLLDYAAQAGLGRDEAIACMVDETVQTQIVETMQADAQVFNVQATPSFIIDGELAFRGAPDVESFTDALNAKLGR